MEPTPDDRHLVGVSASGSGEIDRSLPPPPSPDQLPLPKPAAGRRPRYRLMIPGTMLVSCLPVATWHIYGHQTFDPSPIYLYQAPEYLVELDHPIGLGSVIVAGAALGWLALEYWLREWRGGWFVILGLLSAIGVGTGIGGRVATAGVSGFNFGGAFFILGSPGIYVATTIGIGVVLYRIAASPSGPCPTAFTTRAGKNALLLSTVVSACAVGFLTVWILTRTSDRTAEEYGNLFAGMAFATAAILGLYLVCLAAWAALWFLLFCTSDLVQKRSIRW